MTFKYITTYEELTAAAAEIAVFREFAIDTEFDRNRHKYGFNICMAQIATPSGVYLIDPLAISPKREETAEKLEPLWQLIRSKDFVKVMHACSEDIRLFAKYGATISNVFDTRIAAKVLCLQANSFQDLLHLELGVSLNKKLQTSNWFKRPLDEERLDYLAGDVVHLLELKQLLMHRLMESKRISWFEEEMQHQLDYEPVVNHDADIAPVIRKKEYWALTPESKFLLRQLWAFRDETARQRDVPPFYILTDEKLFQISERTTPLITGQAGKLSPYVNERKLISIFNDALEKTRTGNFELPRDQRIRPPKPGPGRASNEEALELFKPVIDYFSTTYGQEASQLLLSEAAVKRIAFAGSISVLPAYAQAEVKQAAERFPQIHRFI